MKASFVILGIFIVALLVEDYYLFYKRRNIKVKKRKR